ncbi:hypothetical protein FZEAL_2194 [Fusarium zealandicum]|uniref:Survival Motor Neuron Gemin2-binding domain-containing protein n=1 Tax=Fusarium zealandicum TaxID=1053134 RepID=A0A8H4URT8_9HYPO|nr:hypothetical protein FZEAL_2194 [Fusarium zealandicum]
MAAKQENLSHEEVWDDSALIDSWNEALQEYKKYHSIHARGGSVRDLETKSQTKTKQEASSSQPEDVQAKEPDEESASAREDPINENACALFFMSCVTDITQEPTASRNESGVPAPQGLPAFPVQTVLGSVQDESLKKLLMSWYYAGYYTGLYEGQQQTPKPRES